MEVNLAMLIMAGGILSIVGLYSFGFRENRQSREDVASAAYAESVISPLVAVLSSTNLPWSTFREALYQPSKDGWTDYFDTDKGIVIEDPTGKAQTAFGKISGMADGTVKIEWPNKSQYGLLPGLVIMHDQDSPVYRISFRATRTPGQLMAQPVYYTEVRFQGLRNQ